MNKHALIIGASGVIGSNLATHLLAQGWQVTGVSRGRTPVPAGCACLPLDATDGAAVSAALAGLDASHVFFTAWARQANEQENIRVNGAMVANVLAALGPTGHLRHAALVTGLKHYLGPFDAYGKGSVPVTPFREEQGRQTVENFYYEQEDRLFDAAARYGFTWSVHRPHTIIGYALGNAMNMGLTLAVYANLCKASGQPFVFPGSPAQWHAIAQQHDLAETDISRLASWWHTDADLGRPMEVMTDMGKSRKAGFLDYQDTQDAFIALFERLKAQRVIPR